MIAQADVQDVVSANQSMYSQTEQEVFDIVAAYSKIMPNIKLFKEQSLTVVYQKPKVLVSDKETLENIRLRMDMGLITKAEALMVLDPNLDETSAEEKLAKIEEEKESNMERFTGMIGNGEDSEADEEAEV